MTREEAFKEYREIDKNHKWSKYDLKLSGLMVKIFDDFESRICENCIQYDEECSIREVMIKYKKFIGEDISTIGCNEFQRKEK